MRVRTSLPGIGRVLRSGFDAAALIAPFFLSATWGGGSARAGSAALLVYATGAGLLVRSCLPAAILLALANLVVSVLLGRYAGYAGAANTALCIAAGLAASSGVFDYRPSLRPPFTRWPRRLPLELLAGAAVALTIAALALWTSDRFWFEPATCPVSHGLLRWLPWLLLLTLVAAAIPACWLAGTQSAAAPTWAIRCVSAARVLFLTYVAYWFASPALASRWCDVGTTASLVAFAQLNLTTSLAAAWLGCRLLAGRPELAAPVRLMFEAIALFTLSTFAGELLFFAPGWPWPWVSYDQLRTVLAVAAIAVALRAAQWSYHGRSPR